MHHQLTQSELRAVQLSTLDWFDAFCAEHQLTYHLACGTLLGAARHEGYIPWDDDLDVMMSRRDYEKLRQLGSPAPDSAFGWGFPGIDGWSLPFAKVWDTRTLVDEATDLPLQAGVGIDVWPLDEVPSPGRRRMLLLRAVSLMAALEILLSVRPSPSQRPHKRLLLRVSKPLLFWLAPARLAGWRDQLAQSKLARGTETGCLVGSLRWSTRAEHFHGTVQLPFEGHPRPVPTGWEAVLTTMYGNYRQLPPESQQISHHAFTATWVSAPTDATPIDRA